MFYELGTGALAGIIIGGVILFLIIVIVIWFISTNNRFLSMNEKCEEALSGIDVQLTKRYDTLTKMLEVTKGYAKHEKETIFEAIKLRNPNSCSSMQDRAECEAEMTNALKNINVVMEQYPQLKADTTFAQLNNAIADVEDNLQASRRTYNSNVKNINTYIVQFPSSIVAGIKHYEKRDYFEADEAKKQDVKIEF